MPEPIIRRSTFTELADYTDHLDRLAERAERAAAAPAAAVGLSERAALASEAARLLWLALTPAVIAASCRATSLLGEPILAGVAPLDQQLLAAHRLRDAGVLEQQAQGQQREPVAERAEVEPEAAIEPLISEETGGGALHHQILEQIGSPHLIEIGDDDHQGEELQEDAPVVDVGEPVAEEQAEEQAEELQQVADQGDEELQEQQEQELPQESEFGAELAAEWVGSPELSALLDVTANTVRSWSGRGWLIEGQHYRKDPSDRRRHQYNVEAVRAAVASRSRKLRGVEARTPAGIEHRQQLRAERLRLRRQAKRTTEPVGPPAEPERLTERVGPPAEPVAGGRLEELLSALLMEVRGSGS